MHSNITVCPRSWASIERHVPQDDYESIKDVEADAEVSAEAIGNDLQQHFNGKQSAEEDVTVLQYLSQRGRLQPAKHK